jgi:hypothetical protein
VDAEVVSVSSETPLPAIGFVPKAAVAPDGSPDSDRVTDPLKPPTPVTVIVVLAEPPCAAVTETGDAERLKSGVLVTVNASEAVLVSEPLTPVTVTV